MQKEILSKYKQRLMNINAKNSTLCRSRIVKRKAFDLFRLKKLLAKNIEIDIQQVPTEAITHVDEKLLES